MSDSEAESVEAVEVEPPKKSRPPISDARRKQMLENLAKGRKKRQENLSNKRLEKEQKEVKKQNYPKLLWKHCLLPLIASPLHEVILIHYEV